MDHAFCHWNCRYLWPDPRIVGRPDLYRLADISSLQRITGSLATIVGIIVSTFLLGQSHRKKVAKLVHGNCFFPRFASSLIRTLGGSKITSEISFMQYPKRCCGQPNQSLPDKKHRGFVPTIISSGLNKSRLKESGFAILPRVDKERQLCGIGTDGNEDRTGKRRSSNAQSMRRINKSISLCMNSTVSLKKR